MKVRARTTTGPDPVVRRILAQTEQTREDNQTSPEIPVVANRPSVQHHGSENSIREVVDSYMETLAQGTVERYRIPPVTPP